MNSKRILRFGVIALGAVALALIVTRIKQMKDAPNSGAADMTLADFGPAPEFSLTERSGKTVTLADMKGKPWIADFIFTRCGGPCPLLSLRMSELQRDYLKKSELSFVSFTVDPEYDTPAVLKEYAPRYGADENRWLFLTGESLNVFRAIRDGFHLAVEKNTDPNQKPGEQVNHSLSFVLVDKNARMRGYYTGNDLESLKRLRRDIDSLLKNG